MFSRPKILFLVSLLFVALLNSIPTYLLNFQFFYQSSIYISAIYIRICAYLSTCMHTYVHTYVCLDMHMYIKINGGQENGGIVEVVVLEAI